MADKNIIKPQSLSPDDNKKILNILNSIKTIKEFVNIIEIPKEHDVGSKIAQKILEKRSRCKKFINVNQIYEIPQIGPERFSEIVSVLLKLKDPSKIDPMLCEIPVHLHTSIKKIRKHEQSILNKLNADSEFRNLFLKDPSNALAQIKIPLDENLKKFSKIQRKKDTLLIPQAISIPGGKKLVPKIKINFVVKLENE